MRDEAMVKAEECFVDMQAIMNRVNAGERGKTLERDVFALSTALVDLAGIILE